MPSVVDGFESGNIERDAEPAHADIPMSKRALHPALAVSREGGLRAGRIIAVEGVVQGTDIPTPMVQPFS